jgi:DNA-binding XRE family transcriptional regulator
MLQTYYDTDGQAVRDHAAMSGQLATLAERIAVRRELPPPATRRALRLAAGVTQGEIAEACGVTRQAVCQWERGIATPGRAALVRYIEVLRLLRGATSP